MDNRLEQKHGGQSVGGAWRWPKRCQTVVKWLAGCLEGRSMGPREMSDMLTINRSKRHHVSVKNWGEEREGVHQRLTSTGTFAISARVFGQRQGERGSPRRLRDW